MNAPPSCTIYGNTHINVGQTTTLCAPSGYSSYNWSTGATTRCSTVCSAGTYGVTVNNSGGCSSTCNVCVTVGCQLSVSICGNTSVCNGQSTTLCATPSGCASYTWSNGAHTRCICVSCPGTYTVSVVNGNGCTGTASVCVTFHSCGGCGNGNGNGSGSNNGDDGGDRVINPAGTGVTPFGLSAITYPNPVGTAATIEFKNVASATTRGTVEIYSLDGRKVAELFDEDVDVNQVYQVKWYPADVPDGTYMYRIVCGENIKTGSMILSKE